VSDAHAATTSGFECRRASRGMAMNHHSNRLTSKVAGCGTSARSQANLFGGAPPGTDPTGGSGLPRGDGPVGSRIPPASAGRTPQEGDPPAPRDEARCPVRRLGLPRRQITARERKPADRTAHEHLGTHHLGQPRWGRTTLATAKREQPSRGCKAQGSNGRGCDGNVEAPQRTRQRIKALRSRDLAHKPETRPPSWRARDRRVSPESTARRQRPG
jgi:hypothetical protein